MPARFSLGLDAAWASHVEQLAGRRRPPGLVVTLGLDGAVRSDAGHAAQVGASCRRTPAEAGMTAAPDGLAEQPQGFFLQAVSPRGRVDLDSAPKLRWGNEWWLLSNGLGFKLYPMCYMARTAHSTACCSSPANNMTRPRTSSTSMFR